MWVLEASEPTCALHTRAGVQSGSSGPWEQRGKAVLTEHHNVSQGGGPQLTDTWSRLVLPSCLSSAPGTLGSPCR